MSLTWKNGKSPEQMIAHIKAKEAFILEGAERALVKAIDEGTLRLQDLLEQATTATGDARAEAGGFPGRHRSGDMVGSISNNSDNLTHEGPTYTQGSFGWFAQYFQQYFFDQDQKLGLNTGGAYSGQLGAHAMQGAIDHAVNVFREELTLVMLGERI